MAVTAGHPHPGVDRLEAEDVVWDLSDLVEGFSFEELLDDADRLGDELASQRGTVGDFGPDDLVRFMRGQADLSELLGRAGAWASLQFAADMASPENGARMQHYQERATAVSTKLIWFDLEWAALDDDRVAELLKGDDIAFADR